MSTYDTIENKIKLTKANDHALNHLMSNLLDEEFVYDYLVIEEDEYFIIYFSFDDNETFLQVIKAKE